MERNELEVTPEPPPEVAAAIAQAVRQAEVPEESAWWRAGIEESLRDDDF